MKLGVLFTMVLAACACGKKADTGTGNGNGTGGGTGNAADCEGIRGNVEALYRADAEAAAAAAGTDEKKKVDVEEMVADNTTMVMNDCAAQPGKVAPCAGKAKTVAELEDHCLIPLDEEGTEGEQLLPSQP